MAALNYVLGGEFATASYDDDVDDGKDDGYDDDDKDDGNDDDDRKDHA